MYNPFTLQDKTILVTGASSGIGKSTALECSKLGATVVITGRNEERLQEVFNLLDCKYNQNHLMVVADLATDDGLVHLVSRLPKLDGVSSNAGILVNNAPIKFLKEELIDQVFQSNTKLHVKLARDLYKKKILNKGTSYVFTVSIGGVTTFTVGNSAYGMAKAALNSFMKFCAVDFAARTWAYCPGETMICQVFLDGELMDTMEVESESNATDTFIFSYEPAGGLEDGDYVFVMYDVDSSNDIFAIAYATVES